VASSVTRHKKIVLALIITLAAFSLARPSYRVLEIDGLERRYLVSEPRNLDTPMPCILVLHGGGGNARQMSRQGFSRLSKEHGFLVIYPEGLDKHWNDGRYDREAPIAKRESNDVKFLDSLLTELESQYPIDPDKIFCMGISNGAFMSHRLGLELSHRLAGIVPIIGGVNLTVKENFPPKAPLSVMIIQGVDDPIVPYEGGAVRLVETGKTRGTVLPTEEAFTMWSEHNKCETPTTQTLADTTDDGCQVTLMSAQNGSDQTEVLLYSIEGGGHTVPGGSQYLPVKLIGKVCHDLDAVDLVAEFCRPAPPPSARSAL